MMERGWTPPLRFFARLKEMIDYRPRTDDTKLFEWNCDDTFRWARRIAKEQKLPWRELEAWLCQHGATCDCSALWKSAYYWYEHLKGVACHCGFSVFTNQWNRAQRMVNGAILATLLLYPLAYAFSWMAKYVEERDANSFIGFIAWTIWLWYMASRFFFWILNAGVDKKDSKG